MLKSLGLNVTQGLRQTILNTLHSFINPSTQEGKEEEAGRWKPDDSKEDRVYQSGGSVPRSSPHDTMENPTQQRVIITGVIDEDIASEEEAEDHEDEEAEEHEEEEEHDIEEDTDEFVSDITDAAEELATSASELVKEFINERDNIYSKVGARPVHDFSQADGMMDESHYFLPEHDTWSHKKKRHGHHHRHMEGGCKKKKKGCQGKKGKGRYKKDPKNWQSVRAAARSKMRKSRRNFR